MCMWCFCDKGFKMGNSANNILVIQFILYCTVNQLISATKLISCLKHYNLLVVESFSRILIAGEIWELWSHKYKLIYCNMELFGS